MPKIAHTCPVCGTTFYDWPCNPRITCGYHCARVHARPDGRREAECLLCGKHFTAWASLLPVYCSRACYKAARGTPEARFWSHVPDRPADRCWLWNGRMRSYHPTFKTGGRKWSAHVFSYVLHHGPVPDGSVVRHTCDVRCCVNPAHLLSGSQAENMADREARHRHPHVGPRKLSDDQVAEVRAMLAEGIPGREIARRFGVSDGLISLIKTGKHRQ